jgi:hypothetical protein
MVDDNARGMPPEQAAILEALAEQIAAIDPEAKFGLCDIGEALRAAEQEIGPDRVDVWAVERCHLTEDQRDQAQNVYFTLGPHRDRLEQMDASAEVVMTLLEGQGEDVDHGVDALETYAPISVPDLAALMDDSEQKTIAATDSHPLLRFGTTAMQELMALKARNGMAIFQNTLNRLIALTLRLEATDLDDKEAEKIRNDLKTGAEEALALFESLALLPYRRTNEPDYIHASWPPVASAWTPFDEAMNALQMLEDRDMKELPSIRDVMRQLAGDSQVRAQASR